MSIEENFISTPPMSKISSLQIIYKLELSRKFSFLLLLILMPFWYKKFMSNLG